MKLLIKIIILALVFYVSYSILAQGQAPRSSADSGLNTPAPDSQNEPPTEDKTINLKKYEYDSSVLEEEDFFPYDEDFFTRKIFQRELPPLTPKERIIWSFRMADTNAFL